MIGMPQTTCPVGYEDPEETWRQWALAMLHLALPMMVLLRGVFLARRRAMDDYAMVDMSAGVQAALVALMVVCLMLQPRLIPRLRQLGGTSVGFLMLFYVFCGFSAIWSPAMAYSLYRAVEVLAICLTIFAAMDYLCGFERVERLALGLSVAVMALDIIKPIRSGTVRLDLLHSNSYPMIAGMVLCYCVGETASAEARRKRRLILVAIVSGAALCLGTSSSANVAALCGLLTLAIVSRSRIRILAMFLLGVVVLLVLTGYIAYLEDAVLTVLFPGKDWEAVRGGNGRLYMWERSWAAIVKQPLLGYGFAVASRILVGGLSAHNSVIDILLGTGFVGLSFFGISVVALLLELRQIRNETTGYMGCWGVFACAFVGCNGTPFLGTQMFSPLFAFAAFTGLYLMHVLPTRRQVLPVWRSNRCETGVLWPPHLTLVPPPDFRGLHRGIDRGPTWPNQQGERGGARPSLDVRSPLAIAGRFDMRNVRR